MSILWIVLILQNMFDNMSGFWRMQCAEEDFRITPKNYSLYLDPEQRDKDLKISWVGINISVYKMKIIN